MSFKLIPPKGHQKPVYGGTLMAPTGPFHEPYRGLAVEGFLCLDDETEAACLIEFSGWTAAPDAPPPRSRAEIRAEAVAAAAAKVEADPIARAERDRCAAELVAIEAAVVEEQKADDSAAAARLEQIAAATHAAYGTGIPITPTDPLGIPALPAEEAAKIAAKEG